MKPIAQVGDEAQRDVVDRCPDESPWHSSGALGLALLAATVAFGAVARHAAGAAQGLAMIALVGAAVFIVGALIATMRWIQASPVCADAAHRDVVRRASRP